VKKTDHPKRLRRRRPPPKARPEREDLPLHQQLGVHKQDVVASGRRVTGPIRQWWQESGLDGVLDRVSLATALKDLGLVSAKVLLTELTNPQCPIEIRRHIAMTMAPKLAVEVRAALSQELAKLAPQQPEQSVGAQTFDLSDLLLGLAQRGQPLDVTPRGNGNGA